MTTARPMKFAFANDFGVPATSRRIEELERDLATARTDVERAREEGRAAGRQEREAQELARIGDALDRLAKAAQSILVSLDGERARLEGDGVDLAMAFARALAGRLLAREPVTEILHLAGEALQNLRSAPHLVLRVAPDVVEDVEKRVKRLAFERGFEGRIVVLGEPERTQGDCRIEWADGGMVRERAAIEAAMEAAVARHYGRRDEINGGRA